MLNQHKNKKRSLKRLTMKEIAKLTRQPEEEEERDFREANKDSREHPEAAMEYFRIIGQK